MAPRAPRGRPRPRARPHTADSRSSNFLAGTPTSPIWSASARPSSCCGVRRLVRCADGARHGARVPVAVGDPSGVSAGAARLRALRRRVAHRIGLLRHGTPARHRRPARGAADDQRSPRGPPRASAQQWSMRSPICMPSIRRAPGSCDLGKPAGFVERQVRGWTERWERSKTSEMPEMDRLAHWLASELPPSPERPADRARRLQARQPACSTRIDPGRIVAVFDWEMSALGDPLVDLGDPAGVLGADCARRAARRADDGDRAGPGGSRATRSSIGTARERPRCLDAAVFRGVRALQDRGGHPADLPALCGRPDRRSALRALRGSGARAGSPGLQPRLVLSEGLRPPEPPYTLSRAPLRRRAPFAWLTRYRSFALHEIACSVRFATCPRRRRAARSPASPATVHSRSWSGAAHRRSPGQPRRSIRRWP